MIDLYVAGAPCQPLTTAAKQEGFEESEGQRVVFFDILNCIYLFHEIPPEARRAAAKEFFRVLMNSLRLQQFHRIDTPQEVVERWSGSHAPTPLGKGSRERFSGPSENLPEKEFGKEFPGRNDRSTTLHRKAFIAFPIVKARGLRRRFRELLFLAFKTTVFMFFRVL